MNKYNLDDAFIVSDILLSLKHLTVSYATSLNEASNKYVYKVCKKVFDVSSDFQKDLFDLAYDMNFYKLDKADSNKINTTYTKFSDKLSDIEKMPF